MLQSFLVYFLTLLLMFLALRGSAKEKEYRLLFNFGVGSFFALMLYTFVMGVRYGVGMDYFSYCNIYNEVAMGWQSIAANRWEPAFQFIIFILAKYKFHFSVFFAVIAFLQIFITFKAFNKTKEILPYLVIAFFSGTILAWQNGLRQVLALTVFIYAIQFISKKNWKSYYLCVLLAFLFHKSAILLTLIYPVFVSKWHTKKYNLSIQNAVVLASVAIGSFAEGIMTFVYERFDSILVLMEYDNYSEYTHNADSTRGIGYFIYLLIVLISVNYSNKVKAYFKNTSYSIFYSLFFFGYIYKNIVSGSIILNRPNYYFIGMGFIVFAFTLTYLRYNLRTGVNEIMFWLLITLLLTLTFALVSNGDESTSRYFFFWENAVKYHNFINAR